MDLSKYYKYIFTITAIVFIAFLQLQNHLYANDVSQYEELSDKVLIENMYRNKIFSYSGEIEKVFKNKYGIITIYFNEDRFTNKITASIFPNLGEIDSNILTTGNKIKIIGTIKEYNGNYQIAPLDKNSIILTSTADFCVNTTKASDISKNMEKTINLSQVSIINNSITQTKKGKTLVKLSLKVDDMVFDGVMFENNYNDKVKELLNSKDKLCIKTKVGQFKGNISLNVIDISKGK